MTKPLKKTARILLHRANIHASSRVVTMHGHYAGARTGSFGVREIEAANELQALGLLVRITGHDTRKYINSGRTTCHTHEAVWQITEEGRKIANNC